MHSRLLFALLATVAAPAIAQDKAKEPTVPIPAAITAERVPALPVTLGERARPYLESRGASFQGWDPKNRAVLIGTR